MLILLLLYPIRFKTYSSQFRRDIMASTGNFKTGLLWRFCWSISAVTARRLNTQANENQSWNWISAKRSSRIRLAVSLRERKYREKKEKILLEGWRLIKDALLAGAQPINIFFSDKKLIEKLPFIQDKGVLLPVDLNIMQRLSSTVTPPGIVAVFNRPDQGNSIQLPTTFQYKKQKLSLTVICDGVKDPSNLGTLIRVCAAAGCSSLITTKGSMDVWDPKVLRCAAGGHFHLPVFYSLPWQSILNHIEENTRIFMADSNIENPKNCAELFKNGVKKSGVYTIDPDGKGSFKVYCDQKTNGGGWTVFQKRRDGSVNFYRGWRDYKNGFGDLKGEFWLGLDKINRLTRPTRNRLRVDLQDTKGKSVYAGYDYFAVASETSKYKLSLGTYSGTAGDSLSSHRGMAFTTKDLDNDKYNSGNCAVVYKGAWWYGSCHHSNLNGLYHNGKHSSYADRVNWYSWKGYHYSAKRAEMKIRPVG